MTSIVVVRQEEILTFFSLVFSAEALFQRELTHDTIEEVVKLKKELPFQ